MRRKWNILTILLCLIVCFENLDTTFSLSSTGIEDTVTRYGNVSLSPTYPEVTSLIIPNDEEAHDDADILVHINLRPITDTIEPLKSNISNPHLNDDEDLNSNLTNGGNVTSHKKDTNSTTIYVVGIVGVIPAAGLIFWCIRYLWRRRKDFARRTNERMRTDGTNRVKNSREYTRSTSTNTDMHTIVSNNSNESVHHREDADIEEKETDFKMDDWEFKRKKLRLKCILGEGNFGLVWKAEADNICGISGTILVAVKTVKSNASDKEKDDLLNEIKIMKKICCHPNVVTILGCCTQYEPHFLILEYIMYGKLLTYLRDHRSKKNYYNFSDDTCALTSKDLTTFAYHVARGMEFLSSKGILHRDLAARNILVDHTKTCKIADFGLSKAIRNSDCEMYEQKSKAALPIRWMAPESLFFSIFTIKSDVWAFGILMWEIVTLGSTPYPGMGARDVIKEVRDGLTPDKPYHCKPELYTVMQSCWNREHEERPNFADITQNLGELLEKQTGYIDLENFPENCYFNMYYSSGEKV